MTAPRTLTKADLFARYPDSSGQALKRWVVHVWMIREFGMLPDDWEQITWDGDQCTVRRRQGADRARTTSSPFPDPTSFEIRKRLVDGQVRPMAVFDDVERPVAELVDMGEVAQAILRRRG